MDTEQIERIATQLMAALIIENRIIWTQDHGFEVNFEAIANEAITGAKFLIKALENESSKGTEQRILREPFKNPPSSTIEASSDREPIPWDS